MLLIKKRLFVSLCLLPRSGQMKKAINVKIGIIVPGANMGYVALAMKASKGSIKQPFKESGNLSH